MNEDFVSYEIAVKLKEKGFDWETKEVYERNIIACRYEDYPKPTISQVFVWLRDYKNINIIIKPHIVNENFMWVYEIRVFRPTAIFLMCSRNGFEKPRQAEIDAIEYAIDNLIK